MHSYTEITTYRRCPKKYYYSRVENIEPVQMGWRIDFGLWMDELLNTHYRGEDWLTAHVELQEQWEADVLPFTDDPELIELPELAVQVMGRYLKRYRDEDWNVLHVQESFEISGIGITPDLVIEQRTTGGIWVVDHKTTGNAIPDEWDLMADTQHLLYVAGMRRLYGDRVQGVVFNHIRSKLPTKPRLNKTVKKELGHPDINNVARIDTDYETLLNFAAENGVPPYEALTERLAELRYSDPFFKRTPLLTPQVSCDIAVAEAKDTIYTIKLAHEDDAWPRTVLPQSAGIASCNSCGYKELCQAELFGLDTTSARLLYTERTPLNREYKEVSKAA